MDASGYKSATSPVEEDDATTGKAIVATDPSGLRIRLIETAETTVPALDRERPFPL